MKPNEKFNFRFGSCGQILNNVVFSLFPGMPKIEIS